MSRPVRGGDGLAHDHARSVIDWSLTVAIIDRCASKRAWRIRRVGWPILRAALRRVAAGR